MRASPPAWIVPFERNSRFVDREILGQLKRKIFSSNRPRRMAIHGLGGVGKTQIVLELAHQTRERWPECSIFWIPAVDHESVQQAYSDIASQLRLNCFNDGSDDAKFLVQRHLNQSASGPWLIIFDNADDLDLWVDSNPSAKDGIMNYLPKSDQGMVIFTTRSRRVAHHLASTEIIGISEMDEQRAIAVLRNSLVNKDLLDDQENTRELVRRLTFLPLAIVQAGSFINQNETDVAGYIHILDGQEQGAIDLLSEDFEDEGRYKSIRNPIADTWFASFQNLAKQNQLAAQCLSAMACINIRDIPIAFLPQPSPLELDKAIGALSSYSFIKVRNADGLIDMHRLVQLAMRNWLKHFDMLSTWQKSAAELFLRRGDEIEGAGIQHLLARRALIPHAIYLLESTANNHDHYIWYELLYRVSGYLFQNGRYREAVKYCLEVLEIDERMGLAEWIVTRHKHLLSMLNGAQGQHEKGEKLCKEALDSSKKIHGSISIPTAQLTLNLAARLYDSGKLDEAQGYCRESLKIFLHCRGIFHADTLNCITSMIQFYISRGQHVNAEELAQQHLLILTRLYGPDHPFALMTQSFQASLYYEQWNLKEAAALGKEILNKSHKVFGPEHPRTLQAIKFLATVLKGQNRDDEALALMAECARLREKTLGERHPDTKLANQYLDEWKKPG